MTTNPEQNPEAEEVEGAGPLRETIDRLQKENRDKDERLRAQAFQLAGIDTSTGLGKAMAKVYEGEPTTEAIKRFATEEYGWQPSETPAGAGTGTGGGGEAAERVRQAEAQAEAATEAAATIPPADLGAAIAEAEAKGDWDKAVSLKLQQLT